MSVFDRLLDGDACETDILACVYGLNQLETRAYFSLLERGSVRVERLAQELDRDRSTVHRAVQTLLDLELAGREAIPLDGGGYCYTYQATDPSKVCRMIEQRLARVRSVVEDGLETFEAEASANQPAVAESTRAASRTDAGPT